jgi:hypothetical protein
MEKPRQPPLELGHGLALHIRVTISSWTRSGQKWAIAAGRRGIKPAPDRSFFRDCNAELQDIALNVAELRHFYGCNEACFRMRMSPGLYGVICQRGSDGNKTAS